MIENLIYGLGIFALGAVLGQVVGIADYKRDHGPGGWFYEKDRLRRAEYPQGIRHAADFIRTFNSDTTHEWDLGDCVLAKFNMIPKNEIRKNKRRLMVYRKEKP